MIVHVPIWGQGRAQQSTVAEAEEQKSSSSRAAQVQRNPDHTLHCKKVHRKAHERDELCAGLGWLLGLSHTLSLSLQRFATTISQAFSFFLSLPSHSLDGCNGHTTKLKLSSSSLLSFCLLYGIQCHQHFFLSRVVCVSLLERCTILCKETPLAHIVQHS